MRSQVPLRSRLMAAGITQAAGQGGVVPLPGEQEDTEYYPSAGPSGVQRCMG